MQAVLYPLDRAVIDDITICLGMDKTSVFNMLGKGESFDEKRYYYFNSELAIDFDNKNKVEFIEFLGGIDGEWQPMIYDISAFEENAENDNMSLDDEDVMEDLRKALHWATIGIGVKNYYR